MCRSEKRDFNSTESLALFSDEKTSSPTIFNLKLFGSLYSIVNVKTIKTMIIILVPVLLFACTALKPVESLSDQELIDKYYATDLDLYMVKGSSGKGNTNFPKPSSGDSIEGYETKKKGSSKIYKLEQKLEVMRQELLKRGYMP